MPLPRRINNIWELMNEFSCPRRHVGTGEFNEFWNSLTPNERIYYLHAPLFQTKPIW